MMEELWDEMYAVCLDYQHKDTEFIMPFYGIFSLSTYGVPNNNWCSVDCHVYGGQDQTFETETTGPE